MTFGQHDELECSPSAPRLGSDMTCRRRPTPFTHHTFHTPHTEAASVHGRAHHREPQRQLALSGHVLPPGLGVVLPRPHPVEEVGDSDGARTGLACAKGRAVGKGSVSDVAAVGNGSVNGVAAVGKCSATTAAALDDGSVTRYGCMRRCCKIRHR